MDRRTIAFAAVMAALMLASAVIVVSDSEESDASSYRYTDSKSFTVGTAVGGTTSNGPSNSNYTWSTSPITGSVPGVSATYGTSGGHECINFSGTPSTANTYTVVAEWTCTSASGVIYEVGDTYKLTVTVTVTGSTPTTYTVYFSAGTGGSVSKSSQSTTSTSGTFSCKATASSGYTFSAWKIGGQAYSTSATVTGNISQHDGQTLLATFTQNTPTYNYTITYNANGGSGAPGNTTDTSTSTSKSITLSSTTPTRSGYTFLGWSTSSSASTASYSAGGTYTFSYGTTDLYAVWQQNTPTTHTVSFSASPSGSGSISSNSITAPDGASYSANENHITFTKGSWNATVTATPASGYQFDYWSSTSGTISSNASITAYFQADAPSSYTVIFHTSPSAGGIIDNPVLTVAPGTAFSSNGTTMTFATSPVTTVTVTPATGYQFGYWSDSSGTINANRTITAYLGEIQPTVTFTESPSNGGNVDVSLATTYYGDTYTTSGNTLTIAINGGQGTPMVATATPATGYVFDHWSSSSGTFTADTTITAYFSPAVSTCSYTVESTPYATITVNGTVISTDYTGTVQTGGTITVSAVMNPNYTFTDWLVYEPDTGTMAYISTLSFTDHIYEDTVYTLEATYTPPTSDPVITFNRNSSSWGSVSQNTLTVVSGTTFTSSGDTITFTTSGTVVATVTATPATGYYFDRWSVSSGTITSSTSIMAYFGEPLRFGYDVGESVSATLYSGNGNLTISGTNPPGTNVTTLHIYDPGSSITPPINITDVLIEGTPTTTGTYNIIVSDGTHLEITINPAGTHTFHTVTFYASPPSGGTMSVQSMSVREGSAWTVTSNEVQIQQPGDLSYRVCTATANPGYDFTAWNRTGTGTVLADMDFTAFFVSQPVQHTVTFYAYPTGAGTFSPPSLTVPHNTLYTVSADGQTLTIGSTVIAVTPASGYAFQEWGVFGSGYITDDENWPGNFTSSTHTITIIADPAEGGTVSQSTISVAHGSTYTAIRDTEYSGHLTVDGQTVTALANNDYTFQAWNHSGTGTVESDMTFRAYFALDSYAFSVRADPSVGGIIIPNQAQMIPVGTHYTTSGNTLTLATTPATVITAEPTAGFRFHHWGSTSGVVDRQMTVVAYFIGTTDYIVEVAVSPEEGGRVSHAYLELPYYTTYRPDTQNPNVMVFTNAEGSYEVTATPSEGYSFDHWEPSVGIVNRSETVTAVFDKDYRVLVKYDAHSTITVDGNAITRDTYFTVNQENRHTVECVPSTGYRFACYTWLDTDEQEVQSNVNPTQLPLSDTEFRAIVVREGNVTVTFDDDGRGSVSPETLTVPAGSRFARQGNSLVLISDPTVRATATPNPGYVLRGWSENADQFIIENTTIKAYFEYDMGNAVWWANKYANNRATIVLDYPQTTADYSHYMKIPLLSFTMLAGNNNPQYFVDSGYVLSIETGYNKRIYVTLTYNGIEKYAASYDPGVWQRYALILDTQNGTLSYQGISSAARNPMSEFNFMDYTPIFTNVIADWSSVEDDLAFARIYHKDVGTGTNHPNFQIGNTATFLNTFGVVMIDPILNIYEQFPAYENLRLNLYSFALYGDTITINNRTFEMDGSYIVIHYDKIGDRNMVSPGGTETFRAPLTNVYITWNNTGSLLADERQCYLTFAERNQTFDLGAFNIGDLTISGEGMWYFTTALWEPYDTVKKTYVMDWNSPFNLDGNGFLLIFIALLVVVLVIMNIFWQPTVLDYAVVFGAGLISLITLGTF